jgi:NADPH-dependent glutamate synthase beta subunit-like oxidoreductase
VELRTLVAPIAIEGENSACAVRCQEMLLGDADDSGRRRPLPKPDSEIVVEAEQVIVAIGQGPELDYVTDDGALVVSRGRIVADTVSQRSGEANVFAGGDAVTGPSTIIEAIAAGQRAAISIDIFLGGKGELPDDTGFAPRVKPGEEHGAVPRHSYTHLPIKARIGGFHEVLEGYSKATACAEACRCLRCDLEE